MKVVLDARSLTKHPVGVGKYVYSLYLYLKNKIKIFLIFEERPKFNLPRKDIVIAPLSKKYKREKGFKRRFFWEQFILPQVLKKIKPDLYHATDNSGIPISLNIPSLLTLHDVIPFLFKEEIKDQEQKNFFKLSTEIALTKARKIFTPSNNSKKDIICVFKIEKRKVKVVPNFLLPSFKQSKNKALFEKYKRKYNLTLPYFIYHGGIAPRKNIDKIIKALGILKKQLSLPVKLIIAGGKNNLSLIKITKKLKLEKDVILTSYLEDEELRTLISFAAASLYPSSYEGFGLPILEGMACRTPVITSCFSSLPEIGGKAVLKINPYKIKELAGAMKLILENEALREKLIKKGQKRLKKFSWQKMGKLILKEYQKILKHKN